VWVRDAASRRRRRTDLPAPRERLCNFVAFVLTFGLAMTTYLFIQGYWAG
jgi:hypothetical protein